MRADGLADRGTTHRGDDRGRVGAGGGVNMRAVVYGAETAFYRKDRAV